MKFYNIFLIFSVLVFSKIAYSQPQSEGIGCPEEDCIENMGDFPPGPPDMDDNPGMMRGKRPEKMSDEKVDKIMKNIMTQHPEFHKKLTDLKEKHPKVFMRTLHKLNRFVRNEKKGPGNKEKLIEVFADEIGIDILIEKYQLEKDPKKRESIKAEILKLMSAAFDKKEEMKLEMITNIQKNLENKKKEFSKRKADKDNIIKDDLEKILKHHEKMEKDSDK